MLDGGFFVCLFWGNKQLNNCFGKIWVVLRRVVVTGDGAG